MLVRSLASFAVATALLGCEKPPSPEAKPAPAAASSDALAAARKPESHHMFRLDYTLTTTEPDKPPSNSAYTLNVEEGSTGEVRLGRNVPLQANAPAASGAPSAMASAGRALGMARMDVGMMLRCSFTTSGDDVLLRSDLEMTSADQAPAIRKITLKGDALVSPGKTAVVSSSEDPATHQKVQLSVTATKLR